jgi:PilZ domain
MMDLESIPLPACRVSSLYLDYGVDSQLCEDRNAIEISDRGMRVRSRWRFEIGAELAVSFVSDQGRLGKRRFTAEGIVVWCEECPGESASYESTLLFLELPDELKQSLRELSFLLAADAL